MAAAGEIGERGQRIELAAALGITRDHRVMRQIELGHEFAQLLRHRGAVGAEEHGAAFARGGAQRDLQLADVVSPVHAASATLKQWKKEKYRKDGAATAVGMA